MKTNFLQANIETVSIVATFAVLSVVVLNQSFALKKDNVSSISTGSIQGQKGNVKAFLATIRYAEGTSGPNGYRTMFTGKQFSSFKDHPRQLQCALYAGKRLCSDAAGAYQFLSTTWDGLGLPDFTPASQDRGAIELLRRAGVLPLVKAGKFEEAIYKASPIWASLPNRYGRSVYGQPVKSINGLRQIYEQNK